MRSILDFYNRYHLDVNGKEAVVVDRDTFETLDGKVDHPMKWQIMHRYNDDFGALANLAAWKVLKDATYHDAARRFCKHMYDSQRPDGGFGPDDYSVPSAGGSVLIELAAAKALGCDWVDESVIDKAAGFLVARQWRRPGRGSDGVFLTPADFDHEDNSIAIRTTTYAVLAILRYAGVDDVCYSFGPEKTTG